MDKDEKGQWTWLSWKLGLLNMSTVEGSDGWVGEASGGHRVGSYGGKLLDEARVSVTTCA